MHFYFLLPTRVLRGTCSAAVTDIVGRVPSTADIYLLTVQRLEVQGQGAGMVVPFTVCRETPSRCILAGQQWRGGLCSLFYKDVNLTHEGHTLGT